MPNAASIALARMRRPSAMVRAVSAAVRGSASIKAWAIKPKRRLRAASSSRLNRAKAVSSPAICSLPTLHGPPIP